VELAQLALGHRLHVAEIDTHISKAPGRNRSFMKLVGEFTGNTICKSKDNVEENTKKYHRPPPRARNNGTYSYHLY
jgi:hypothetical protein